MTDLDLVEAMLRAVVERGDKAAAVGRKVGDFSWQIMELPERDEARATLAAHLPEVLEFLATQQVRVDRLSSETLPPGAGNGQGKSDGEQAQSQPGSGEEPTQESDEALFTAPAGEQPLSYINVRA